MIFTIMEFQFCSVRSAKDLFISLSLIILGFVLMFMPDRVGMNIGGFFLFLIGALFLFLFKSVYTLNGGKEKYIKKEFYFSQEHNHAILKAVLDNPKSIDVSVEGQGKTIKLNLYYSSASGKAYLQLFEYIPYAYEPMTAMLEYDINDVSNLIK